MSLADTSVTPLHHTFAVVLKRAFIVLLSLCGIAALLYLDRLVGMHGDLPALQAGVSYGLLLLAGFLTSFHCAGMCGPLVFGYTLKAAKRSEHSHRDHILYGIGKTLSYTVIGALFGGLGAAVTFTPMLRGVAGIVAGGFVLLFGLGVLKVFSGLERLHIGTPGIVMRFIGRAYKTHHHPFVIGLLNGLMIICGPLQAMYILAAGTGSALEGARMLFMFGIGTLPVMLGLGFLTTTMSARLTPKLVHASGFIVMALGIVMLNRGLALTGAGYDFDALLARWSPVSVVQQTAGPPAEQTIHMEVNASGFVPNEFTLRRGVPVKWIINGVELNQCNERIVVPAYHLEIALHPGENLVEFVPDKAGVVAWSCWMGMIPGRFIVEEPAAAPASTDMPVQQDQGADPKWLEILQKIAAAIKRWVEDLAEQLKRYQTLWQACH